MKKILMSLLLALTALSASAQFETGKCYLNTSLTGLDLAFGKGDKLTLGVNASAGCFIVTDWMLLAQASYDHQRYADQFMFGMGTRYHIEENGMYVGVTAQYGHSSVEQQENFSTVKVKDDHFFVVPEVGYTFFLNHYLTLEPALYYRLSLDDFKDASKVGLRIGFGYYF